MLSKSRDLLLCVSAYACAFLHAHYSGHEVVYQSSWCDLLPVSAKRAVPMQSSQGIGPGERLLHLAQYDLEGAVASRRIDLISTIGRKVEWMKL